MDILQVYKPQPKQKRDNEGQNLALAAAALGLIAATGGAAAIPMIGGAAGLTAGGMATAGAIGAGGAIGGAALGIYGANRALPKQARIPENLGYSESSAGRRMAAMTENPLDQLMAAKESVDKMAIPYEQKTEYYQPINQAIEKYKARYT